MSNLKICPENFLVSMDLSAYPAAAAPGPVENVVSLYRGQSFIAQSASPQEILGSSQTALWGDGFAIHDHNFSEDSTFRLYLYAEPDQLGEAVFDSGEVSGVDLIPLGRWRAGIDPYGGRLHKPSAEFAIVWFEPVVFYSFKLVLVSSTTVKIGNLFLGKSLALEHNFSWGSSLVWKTGTELLRTAGGSLVADSNGQAPYRTLTLTLPAVLSSERADLTKALVYFATSPMLISAYPNNADFSLESAHNFLAIPSPAAKWAHARRRRHTTTLTFNEI